MIELVISDSGSIRNPSKFDIDNALLRVYKKKSDFIILNVDKQSFIQATCQKGRFSIEYRIRESELIRIKKTFTYNQATFFFKSFLAGNFLPVQSAASHKTLNQNDRHLQLRDKKNIRKVNIVNALFRFAKTLVPFQVAFCLVVVVDLFILEGNTQVYSATSMQTEYGGLGFDRGLKVIAPKYAKKYFVIHGRTGQNNIRVSSSRTFGEHVSYGKQFSVTSSNLLKLTKGLSIETNESAIITESRDRYILLIFILSVTVMGILISKHGKTISAKDYEDLIYDNEIINTRAIVIYTPAIFLIILSLQFILLFSE